MQHKRSFMFPLYHLFGMALIACAHTDIKFSTTPPLGAGLHTYCYLSLLDTIGSVYPIVNQYVIRIPIHTLLLQYML